MFDLDRIGAGLPVGRHLAEITDAINTGAAVLEAPPGTGKTTLVPPLLANLLDADPEARAGRVLVAQPRRVAARAAAARLAQLSGTAVGDLVGHVTRGDVQRSARTRVEFCTTGVLVRRLLDDPELAGVGAVILDEIHERHLDDDLALAMLAEVRQLAPELKVLAMSATAQTELVAGVLGGAPVVQVDSALYPLAVHWAPPPELPVTERGVTAQFLDHVADQTVAARAELPDREASILVFVPGAWEVEQVCQRLRGRVPQVQPLHGRLEATEQDAAIHGTGPRVVVATAVAESSVTVAGVRLVVDSGVAREPRFDSVRAITGLVTVPVSRATAIQRAGRAARLGPGTVIRCLAAETWSRLPADPPPEIRTADLTAAALDLARWGTPGGRDLALPDPPPEAALARAEEGLRVLGAIADDGTITAHGRQVAAVATDPRLAHALLAVVAAGMDRSTATEVVALLTDPGSLSGDLSSSLTEVRRTRPRFWQHLVRQLARQLERLDIPGTGGRAAAGGAASGDRVDGPVAQVVARAWPDRLARRRGDQEGYLLSGGTGALAPDLSPGDETDWLAVAELDHFQRRRSSSAGSFGTEARIRSFVPISEALALTAGEHLLTEDLSGWFDGRVRGRQIRRLGAIELSRTPVPLPLPEALAAIAAAVADRGLSVVGWNDQVEGLRRRLALVHHHLGEPWPSMDPDHLAATAATWLAPEFTQLAGGAAVAKLDLAAALRRNLPWPEAGRLDELVPERITVPTGSTIAVDYPADPADPPVVAVKLQELFGLTTTPRLCAGRVPVLFHLLSPARRPLAVTDDLASFWAGAYQQVRAENRGRYSKHPWPQDPLTAPPQRGTRRS